MNINAIIAYLTVAGKLCQCGPPCGDCAALYMLRDLRYHLPTLIRGEHEPNCHRNHLTVPDVRCCAYCRARAVLVEFQGKEVPPCPTH